MNGYDSMDHSSHVERSHHHHDLGHQNLHQHQHCLSLQRHPTSPNHSSTQAVPEQGRVSWKGVIPDTEMVPDERYSESSAGQTKSLETKVWQATANSTTVYMQQLENDLAVYVQQTEDIFTPNNGNLL